MLRIYRVIFIIIAVCISGCTWSTEKRLSIVEKQLQEQQILDIRLSHAENRLHEVEQQLHELQDIVSHDTSALKKVELAKKKSLAKASSADHLAASLKELGEEGARHDQEGALVLSVPKSFTEFGGEEGYTIKAGGVYIEPYQAKSILPDKEGQAAGASVKPSATVLDQEGKEKKDVSEKSLYDKALALYEKRQYALAEAQFTSFFAQYPHSKLAPNALYWLGECAYSTGRLDSSIIFFKDVVEKYPTHPKAAAALLKAGFAYDRMGDAENAHFYWQILLDDFPASAPAALARKKMAKK